MANRLYERFKDKQGEPLLHPSYVVFADLLGTSERIRAVDPAGELALLTEVVQALNGSKHCISDGDRLISIIRYYSDCVSIITPAMSESPFDNSEGSFGFTVLKLISWQAEMVRRGVFIRGGLSFGGVFVDDHSLLGKAHLEAYELETKRAIYPRVILGKSAVEMAAKQANAYSKDFVTPHQELLLVDRDNEVFLHYLKMYSDEEHEENNPVLAEVLLANHKRLVEEQLSASKSDHIRKKYEWVASYHNWFCDLNWSKCFNTRDHKVTWPTASFQDFREWVNL